MAAEEILIMVLLVALVAGGYRLIRRAVRLGTSDALREHTATASQPDRE